MKMEQWEIQSMKEELVMLKYNLEGMREGEALDNALNYINYLEERLYVIANSVDIAKQLLRGKGYFIGKVTGAMERDWKVCEKQNYEGDCSCCSCSICIMQ